jgi:hypothetical protein
MKRQGIFFKQVEGDFEREAEIVRENNLDTFDIKGTATKNKQVAFIKNIFAALASKKLKMNKASYLDRDKWRKSKNDRYRLVIIDAQSFDDRELAAAIVNCSPIERILLVNLHPHF